MTEDKIYELVNIYAQNNPLSNNIDVLVHRGGVSMKPKPGKDCYYNDAQVLSRMINGAEHFLFWMARMGYDLVKKRSKK